MDLIIRNANVNGENLDIGIVGNKVTALEKKISQTASKEINADGRVAIPGFVDCHLHLDKSLLNERAEYQDLTGPEKGALTREEKAKFTVEDITERAERILLQGVKAGNLIIRTNVDVDPIVGVKGIEALLSLKEKYKDILEVQVAAFSQEGFLNYPESKELLEEAMEMGADLVGGHTIVDNKDGEKHIDTILEIAKKYDVEADFHLDESGNRQHYLLPYLAKKMIADGLKGRVNGIHCCTLSALNEEEKEEALALIKESELKVTAAPTAISTRALAPVKDLLNNETLMGLGSDNVRDFFNPLGSGDVKQVALLLSYVHRFFTAEEEESIWKMITVDGAKLLGHTDYGIKVDGEANITLLDGKTPKEVIANQSQTYAIIRKGVDYSQQFLARS
ncbi:amidohydrolase family protein [Natronincola ferrireducens]|uniref:Cytosine deaminase n=1 Tax=Natronincola ferrireducens TaxID=393762 RepID=A0A1G9G197_9FIRM|nr:amidohydrolase family protein [Natronincola ferrireducens]SDK94414.1 cytosine deaminase [Natronincola ferrireducens]